jgi:hypothetical protein
MIIPLKNLFGIRGNKYLFTKAAMHAVDKVGNITDYPEDDLNWKVVPNVLKILLEDKIQYALVTDKDRAKAAEQNEVEETDTEAIIGIDNEEVNEEVNEETKEEE